MESKSGTDMTTEILFPAWSVMYLGLIVSMM